MKALVNKKDRSIRILAPNIEFIEKHINGFCYDDDAYRIGFALTLYAKEWELIEIEPDDKILEQAAKEYAKINDKSSITKGFSIVKFATFKAGVEWMKKYINR